MPKPTQYVALLRGINVGGNNIIKMTSLAALFAELDLSHVRTYIQSGNVLFSAPAEEPAKLTRRIEAGLSQRFCYEATVVVRSDKQMKALIARAPDGFGASPQTHCYDVLFLMAPLKASSVLEVLPQKPGVDEVAAGSAEIYFSRLISKATQSKLRGVLALPIYQSMTIRNWNTTLKLHHLLAERT